MGLFLHTVSAGETSTSLRQGEGEASGVKSRSAASLRPAGVVGLLMGDTLTLLLLGVVEHTLLQNCGVLSPSSLSTLLLVGDIEYPSNGRASTSKAVKGFICAVSVIFKEFNRILSI